MWSKRVIKQKIKLEILKMLDNGERDVRDIENYYIVEGIMDEYYIPKAYKCSLCQLVTEVINKMAKDGEYKDMCTDCGGSNKKQIK